MKRTLCILLTFPFILILLASCSTSISSGGNADVKISINGNEVNEKVETSDDSTNDQTADQTQEQTSTSKPTWLYVLLVAIGLPLFAIGIWLITIIVKVYRNRNKQF